MKQRAAIINAMLGNSTMVLFTNETGNVMSDLTMASERTGQTKWAQKYGRFYTLAVVRWLSHTSSPTSHVTLAIKTASKAFLVITSSSQHTLWTTVLCARERSGLFFDAGVFALSYNSPIWFILSVSPNRKDESMDDSPYDPAQIPAPATYHWTPRLQRDFLEAFATNGSVKISAAKVGMSPSAVYQLKQRPEGAAFRIGCAAAGADCADATCRRTARPRNLGA